MNGRPVDWEGTEIQLKWAADKPEIPLYVAAYGPRALGVAGRVGDGVIIQLADPAIIEWTMATARRAAEEAGRDPAALKCLVCAPSQGHRRHRRRRATRSAGSRRWSATTWPTSSACTARPPTSRAS